MTQTFNVVAVSTKPIEGQKTGTSGLRKKVAVFKQQHYLSNWVQSLFNALKEQKGDAAVKGSTMVVGGDGRYWNKEAIQIIIKMAAANGVGKLLVGQNGILSTPAVSAVIRGRKAFGGFILTASHNPGGPNADWGIKYNTENGGPAPETLTDVIYTYTQNISEYYIADSIPYIDLSTISTHSFTNADTLSTFEVQVIDSVEDYLALLKTVFDFSALKNFFATRKDFRFLFDSMHGVTGVYSKRIFHDELGAPIESLMNYEVLEDFGGCHPDPNLTYAEDLVKRMYSGESAPDMGAASDGDGDRNMILGKNCFVTPSDSVAIIASLAQQCIPYFKNGLKGLARSMPTSTALDRVAQKLGVEFFVVPTGWKYFGNLMDAGRLSICGEESFGTGSDHIREKDGIWAILAWLSILAYKNQNSAGGKLVSIEDIVREHWREFGRSFYCRYDYEEVDATAANNMIKRMASQIKDGSLKGKQFTVDGAQYTIADCDEFEYHDPIDKSVARNQGLRFKFTDGSVLVYRLSGTGSVGATVRVYMEKYEKDNIEGDTKDKVKAIAQIAQELSQIKEFTGRSEPTVIT